VSEIVARSILRRMIDNTIENGGYPAFEAMMGREFDSACRDAERYLFGPTSEKPERWGQSSRWWNSLTDTKRRYISKGADGAHEDIFNAGWDAAIEAMEKGL
jgi:hypothetical protein